MQARAIFEAAVQAGPRYGAAVVPEIMVPLVGLRAELDYVKARIEAVAKEVVGEAGVNIDYLIGTMIELRGGPQGGHDRRIGGFLLFRHQRPDADHLRHFAR